MPLARCLRFIRMSISPAARMRIVAAFGATAIHIIALLAQPILVAKLVRDVSTSRLSNTDMATTLAVLATAMLLSALFAHLQAHCNNLVLQDIRQGAKSVLYADFLERPTSYFRDRNEGWIESSIATASQAARSIVYDGVTALARVALFILLCTALLTIAEPLFGLLFLFAAIVYLAFSYRLAISTSHLVGTAVASTASVASRATDVLANVEQVQLADRVDHERELLRHKLDVERVAYLAAQGRIDRSEFLQRLYLIALFGFFVLATALIASGDPAIAVLFYIVGLIAYGQLDSTGKVLNSVFEMAHKLDTVLNQTDFQTALSAPEPRATSIEVTSSDASIRVDNVSFAYSDGKPILTQLSFVIEPSTHVLVTGKSGTGKSTLLRLIAGLSQPSNGRVHLAGIPTDRLSVAERAERLSFISQHAALFDRSLLENATYGCQAVDREHVESVLIALGLGSLKARGGVNWLDQRVDKNGLGLSGGERQRVLLARAILRERPIVILDEATSALDSENEKQVFAVLHELCVRATIIAVSHHPHTALTGYRRIRIDDGKGSATCVSAA